MMIILESIFQCYAYTNRNRMPPQKGFSDKTSPELREASFSVKSGTLAVVRVLGLWRIRTSSELSVLTAYFPVLA